MTPGGLLTPEQASSVDNVIAEDDQVSLQIQDFRLKLLIYFQTSPSDAVSPAQFDWNKSGLTNPLAENGE